MDDLFEDPDDAVLKLEQFSSAFLGIAETNGKAPCACYSKKKIIEILQRKMSLEDALNYFEFDILSYPYQENPPVFLDD
tara:strand:- start:5299 stop:5535 length:237 start_codon:yes stop_codon:yes gene_type:complete